MPLLVADPFLTKERTEGGREAQEREPGYSATAGQSARQIPRDSNPCNQAANRKLSSSQFKQPQQLFVPAIGIEPLFSCYSQHTSQPQRSNSKRAINPNCIPTTRPSPLSLQTSGLDFRPVTGTSFIFFSLSIYRLFFLRDNNKAPQSCSTVDSAQRLAPRRGFP